MSIVKFSKAQKIACWYFLACTAYLGLSHFLMSHIAGTNKHFNIAAFSLRSEILVIASTIFLLLSVQRYLK